MEHQIITAWAGLGIGVGQLIMIGWGLRQMGKASEERTLPLDIMGREPGAARMREESPQLNIGQGMREPGDGRPGQLDSTQPRDGVSRYRRGYAPGDGVSRYRPGDTRPGDTRPGADPSVSRHRAGDTRK